MFSSSAELTEIAESANGLVVSNIVQKAGISVTEMGTVAYAATGKYKTVTSLLRPIIWDGWKRIYFRAVIIRQCIFRWKFRKLFCNFPTQINIADNFCSTKEFLYASGIFKPLSILQLGWLTKLCIM